jgi:prophage DNA circulation protein
MVNWQITDGSYKGIIFHVAIPKPNQEVAFGATSQEITNERRLQVSENPLVDGGQVEDFGRKPRMFSSEIVFFGHGYAAKLKDFENKLNEGTSGKLILPDLDEAVWAKYQKHSRRTSAQEGRSTILSVSWIEDISRNNELKPVVTKVSLNGLEATVANINSACAGIQQFAAGATDVLNNNPVVNAIKTAQATVTNARVTINSVTNVARNLREQIINQVLTIQNDIAAMKEAITGITHFTDIFTKGLKKSSPTQYNTGLGLVDYKTVGVGTTAQVSNGTQVVTTNQKVTSINSFEDAKAKLEKLIKSLSIGKAILETQTQGATVDYSKSSIILINSVKDLITLLDNKSTKQVLTTTNTSLLEICFENNRSVEDVDNVYNMNRHLDDILDIPRDTVIYL